MQQGPESAIRAHAISRSNYMSIYLSVGSVQPFAKISTEFPEDEPGISVVIADGKVVGLRIDKNEDVLRLPGLIEKFGLNPEYVWARLRGDDDVTLGRRGVHGRK
jgi:hypothetical protein